MAGDFDKSFGDLIRKRTLNLRTRCQDVDPWIPRFMEMDFYKLEKKIFKRLRVILRSNGCSVPTCTMCPFPNAAADPKILKIRSQHYIAQLKLALKKYPNPEIISIYNDGNFFADSELENETRRKIYNLVKEHNCQYLMVESLPLFMNDEKISEAHLLLGGKIKLLVGIGLQSFSDEIRQICIRTQVTKHDFLKAHAILGKYNFALKCYLIVKPPFVLEEEAITDIVEGSVWLSREGIKDITLCPVRIAQGTVLQSLYDCKLYAVPKLATFIECLYQLQLRDVKVRVSIFNVTSSDLDAIVSQGCDKCMKKIISGVNAYNNLETVDFSQLRCATCIETEKNNDPAIFRGLSYIDRVRFWNAITSSNGPK